MLVGIGTRGTLFKVTGHTAVPPSWMEYVALHIGILRNLVKVLGDNWHALLKTLYRVSIRYIANRGCF